MAEIAPRRPGRRGARGRVNDHLCLNRLAAGAIGDDDAGRLTIRVMQNVGGHGAVEILHAGREQGFVQRDLHLHRRRRRPDRIHDLDLPVFDQQQFTEQNAFGVFGFLYQQLYEAARLFDLTLEMHLRIRTGVLILDRTEGTPESAIR